MTVVNMGASTIAKTSGVPAASVIFHPGTPSGYLPADGSIVSQADYPGIFAEVGLIGQVPPDGSGFASVAQTPAESENLSDVVLHNGEFLALSSSTFMASPSGETWTERTSPGSVTTMDTDGSRVVAISSGTAYYSDDGGVTWQSSSLPSSHFAISCHYSEDLSLFVAGCVLGLLCTSPDGVTWTARTTGLGSGEAVSAIFSANSLLVAATNSGDIITSPDGVTWTARTSGTTKGVLGIAFGAGVFVVVGETGGSETLVLTSPDGITWTVRTNTLPNRLRGITFVNSVFVAVGDSGLIATSADGITWTEEASPTAEDLSKIASTQNTLVAVGDGGTVIRDVLALPQLAAANGQYFEEQSTGLGSGQHLNTVIFEQSEFLAQSSGNIVASSDGETWVERTSPGTTVSIAGNGSRVIALGTSTAYRSDDQGDSWSSASLPGGNFASTLGYASTPGLFIAGTLFGGNILTSPDGITWTARSTTASATFTRVREQNSLILAALNDGDIYTSTDGITWTERTTPTSNTIGGFAFGAGLHVAVGGTTDVATIMTSPDGITWTERSNTIGEQLLSVVFDGTQFVAVGTDGAIATSPDGITWTAQSSPTSTTLNSVAFGSSVFVAVGANGTAVRDRGSYAYNEATQFQLPTVADLGDLGAFIKT